MPRNQRLAILAIGGFLAIGAFIQASRSSDKKDTDKSTTAAVSTSTTAANSTTTKPESTTATTAKDPRTVRSTINVVGCNAKGKVKKIEANKGQTLKLTVNSDCADEIHVHGYNVAKDVTPTKSAKFEIKLTADGNFEIELEGRGNQIAELAVRP